MITRHLTETEIQQLALDRSGCETEVIEHMEQCEACTAKAATYQLLFSGIKQLPAPAFDIDLAGTVLVQLAPVKPSVSRDRSLVYVFAFLILGSASFSIYLFWDYFIEMFTGVLPIVMYLIVVTAINILFVQGFDLYKRIQKQMKALNF